MPKYCLLTHRSPLNLEDPVSNFPDKEFEFTERISSRTDCI
jgi:hypothetical protein